MVYPIITESVFSLTIFFINLANITRSPIISSSNIAVLYGLKNTDTYTESSVLNKHIFLLSSHVVSAPSSKDSYKSSSFSGLQDLLFGIEDLPEDVQTHKWSQVQNL